MTVAELISLHSSEQSNGLTVWAFYAATCAAFIGLLLASRTAASNKNFIIILNIAFIIFAIITGWLSWKTQTRLLSISEALNMRIALNPDPVDKIMVETYQSIPIKQVVACHIILDIAMLVLMWTIYLLHRKAAKTSAHAT